MKFEEFIKKRTNNNYDLKVVITGRDSRTGVGKTTLALDFAEHLDPDFDAREQCVFTVSDYLDAFYDLDLQKSIVWEEAQIEADNRRSFSGTNVYASQLWSIMRFREVYSILTLPTRSMLDKRLIELSDIVLVCVSRGRAHPYQTKVGDVDGSVTLRRFKDQLGNKSYINYPKHDDENFEIMTDKKQDHVDEWVKDMLEDLTSD